jgi:hypothetical protein
MPRQKADMIQIGASQLTRLQEHVDTAFARSEAEQLALYAPPLAASAGQAGLEAAVLLGLKAARRAGFTEAAQVRLYLQLMTSFGSHFDTDPQYEWLHHLLNTAEALTARERARLLYWHSSQYLQHAYGKNGLHGIAAAMRASRLDTATLATIGAEYANRGAYLLAHLHPQRGPYLTTPIIEWLLKKAADAVTQNRLDDAAAAPLLLCLMFGFGHGVLDDPLYPWVRDTLANTKMSGTEKVTALLARAQGMLTPLLQQVREARH